VQREGSGAQASRRSSHAKIKHISNTNQQTDKVFRARCRHVPEWHSHEPVTLNMHRLDPEDEKTATRWTIRLTIGCALAMLSLFAFLAAGSNFGDPQ
jgi:hypothetical protein